MRRLNRRIELDVISAAPPRVRGIAQQIVHMISIALNLPELINRHIDEAVLFPIGIEIHYDKNNIVAGSSHLGVEQNRVVLCKVKSQVIVKMKRAIFPSDFVQPCNPIFNVSRSIPIPLFELVFFGIEILLTIRQSLVLAQLVSAVDAIER